MLTSFLNFHLFFNFISNFFFFQLFFNCQLFFKLANFFFTSSFSFRFKLFFSLPTFSLQKYKFYSTYVRVVSSHILPWPTPTNKFLSSQISFIKHAWKHHPELTEMGNLERKDPFNFPNHLGWPHFPNNNPPQRCLLMVLHTILYT